MKNFWIIFIVGPTSARDYKSGDQVTASEDLYYASHDTSLWTYIMPHKYFRDIYHYKYDIIPVSISFSHSSVSWVIYYILSSENVHSVFKIIQYPWLANYGDQEYSIRSIISLVSLFQVQEYMGSGVPDIW